MKKILMAILILSVLLLSACGPSEPKVLPYPGEGASPPPEGYEYEAPPAPTPTPSPAPPPIELIEIDAELTYLTYLEGHLEGMSYAMGGLAQLVLDPQFSDDDWKAEVLVYMVLIKLGYEEAQAMDCPSSMSHIHNIYVQGLSHFSTAMDLLAEGIDYFDADSISRATTEMDIGAVLIGEAAQLMIDYLEHE